MKKLSFKKKSVNDEIITKEPRPVKDRSIKHIFKMNFLPITFLLYSVVIISIVLLFMAGSSDESSEISGDNDNSNIWMAKELMDDMVLAGGMTSISIEFGSLKDGDFIIIKDTISDIDYDSDVDVTTVTFEWTIGDSVQSMELKFEGDIRGLYKTGDQVKISVTIKYVSFTLEPPDVLQEMTYEMEIFEKQWVSEEFYADTMATSLQGLKALPQSSISKA